MTDLQTAFDMKYRLTRAEAAPDWATRLDRLKRLDAMVREGEEAITKAISADFGNRAKGDTQMAEIFPSLAEIAHARHHGKRWMKKRRVSTAVWFKPGRSFVLPQPKGLVGIIGPWNYPLFLLIGPLAGAFAAGNRAMVKTSEYAPAFADWFAGAVGDYFGDTELTVHQGGPDMGAAFSALPFDHLFFTGNGQVGRKVMAAAAPNLTPVTLELGGKSPVIVTENADMERTVARVMTGKMLNAGQTCVAPDYVLIARGREGDFIAGAKDWVAKHYPKMVSNPDMTRIIDKRQFDRLMKLRDAAMDAGARLTPLTDHAPDPATRLFPPVIAQGVPTDNPLMREEIFGPILPLIPFDDLAQAADFVTARPRPLAVYYFSEDREEIDALSSRIVSGGACYNETVMHVAQGNLPFGGVGNSGMGAYHGRHGFDTFSHLRATFVQPKWNAMGMLAPPYGRNFRAVMAALRRLTRI